MWDGTLAPTMAHIAVHTVTQGQGPWIYRQLVLEVEPAYPIAGQVSRRGHVCRYTHGLGRASPHASANAPRIACACPFGQCASG
jgi:hypothetical protein